jgi:peptidyl-dipeptidase A
MWRDAYEDEKFVENIDKMWSEVEPLYEELHKYVRRKLKEIYQDKLDISDDLIPAHVLGE